MSSAKRKPQPLSSSPLPPPAATATFACWGFGDEKLGHRMGILGYRNTGRLRKAAGSEGGGPDREAVQRPGGAANEGPFYELGNAFVRNQCFPNISSYYPVSVILAIQPHDWLLAFLKLPSKKPYPCLLKRKAPPPSVKEGL